MVDTGSLAVKAELQQASTSPELLRERGSSIIPNIQALRAAAAISVVVYHAIPAAERYQFSPGSLSLIRGWGFQGVDMFFVISGFVIVYTQHGKSRNILQFLLNRVSRIAPLYWLLTTVIFLVALAAPSVFTHGTPNAQLYLLSVAFSAHLFGHLPPLLYVGWTLEYEMAFYLVLTCCLWLKRLDHIVFANSFLLLGLIALNLLQPIAIEFMLGELCALFYLTGRKVVFPELIFLAGVAGMTVPFFYGPAFETYFHVHRALYFALPSAALLVAALYMRQTNSRLLIFLGNASYSIYLTQVIAISVVYKLLKTFSPTLSMTIASVICVLASCAIGVICYHLLERPITAAVRQFTGQRGPRTVGAQK